LHKYIAISFIPRLFPTPHGARATRTEKTADLIHRTADTADTTHESNAMPTDYEYVRANVYE